MKKILFLIGLLGFGAVFAGDGDKEHGESSPSARCESGQRDGYFSELSGSSVVDEVSMEAESEAKKSEGQVVSGDRIKAFKGQDGSQELASSCVSNSSFRQKDKPNAELLAPYVLACRGNVIQLKAIHQNHEALLKEGCGTLSCGYHAIKNLFCMEAYFSRNLFQYHYLGKMNELELCKLFANNGVWKSYIKLRRNLGHLRDWLIAYSITSITGEKVYLDGPGSSRYCFNGKYFEFKSYGDQNEYLDVVRCELIQVITLAANKFISTIPLAEGKVEGPAFYNYLKQYLGAACVEFDEVRYKRLIDDFEKYLAPSKFNFYMSWTEENLRFHVGQKIWQCSRVNDKKNAELSGDFLADDEIYWLTQESEAFYDFFRIAGGECFTHSELIILSVDQEEIVESKIKNAIKRFNEAIDDVSLLVFALIKSHWIPLVFKKHEQKNFCYFVDSMGKNRVNDVDFQIFIQRIAPVPADLTKNFVGPIETAPCKGFEVPQLPVNDNWNDLEVNGIRLEFKKPVIDEMTKALAFLPDKIKELIARLKDPVAAKAWGVSPNRLCALAGPAGTGKSTMAEIVAYQTNRLFCYKRVTELYGAYRNHTERAIIELFDAVRKCKEPLVLFLDEIDGIAKSPKSDTNGSALSIAQTLNTQIDKLMREQEESGDVKIFIIGATNYLDIFEGATKSRTEIIDISGNSIAQIAAYILHFALEKNVKLSATDATRLAELVNPVTLREVDQILRRAGAIAFMRQPRKMTQQDVERVFAHAAEQYRNGSVKRTIDEWREEKERQARIRRLEELNALQVELNVQRLQEDARHASTRAEIEQLTVANLSWSIRAYQERDYLGRN